MKIKTLCGLLLGTLLLGACVQVPDIPKAPTLDLSLPVAAEEEVVWQSQDYQGKPVLVAVMATWCPWCKRSLPALDATTAAFGDQVEVVGVFVDDDLATVKKVQKEHNIKSKILYQGDEAAHQLHAEGFPHIVLFDKNHKLVKVWSGYSDKLADEYKAEIDKLLK
ncbi:MAG: TlpA family protein disulfide reductase [Elusimicrobiaceae bacterium]|nr:TlpA family protein disulfide reductase [Elusimicrobiaceae bacterium]